MSIVLERYIDAHGREVGVPERTQLAFRALLDANAEQGAFIPAATVVRIDEPPAIVTTLPAGSWSERLGWTIALEGGGAERGVAELRDAPVIASVERDGERIDARRITLPALPLGYHQISAEAGAFGRAQGALIVVPRAAHKDAVERSWGIATQLYTLRSPRNWGIGDFSDLRALAKVAGRAGARYVGVNPLHAPHRSDPEAASPYAPTSRRFLNWLMIDVEAVPEAGDPGVRAAIEAPAFAAQLEALRERPLVDYTGVAACKDAILRRCFALLAERTTPDPAFAAFVEAGGMTLERFAIFETLAERFGRDLDRWPASYRDPASDDVRAFAAAEREAIAYAQYLQYLTATQLQAVARDAAADGVMLYIDLAVGVDANSADVWLEPHAYVNAVNVGAPPDLLNPIGQNWGLPPLDPRRLATDGYRTLAALLRANMAAAGALRIDHAMSLSRLFWIPRGAAPADGGYVAYPLEDVVGVLALESVRARCIVIGEDLGTVPDGFRETMAAARILSYKILFFERTPDGGFVAPDQYPECALAATGTHDLATVTAWLDGSDIALAAELGTIDAALAPGLREARAADRRRLLEALAEHAGLDPVDPSADDIVEAAHRFLARTPAAVVMLQLEDAIGESTPVNVPGTFDQYPNWRRKLALDIAAIADDRRFVRLCTTLREQRPRPNLEA